MKINHNNFNGINFEGLRLMFVPKENVCDIRRAIEYETEHQKSIANKEHPLSQQENQAIKNVSDK